MEKRNRKRIGEKGNRTLNSMEIRQPDGVWVPFYEGEEYMTVHGVRKWLPTQPFGNEAEGLSWLNGG